MRIDSFLSRGPLFGLTGLVIFVTISSCYTEQKHIQNEPLEEAMFEPVSVAPHNLERDLQKAVELTPTCLRKTSMTARSATA